MKALEVAYLDEIFGDTWRHVAPWGVWQDENNHLTRVYFRRMENTKFELYFTHAGLSRSVRRFNLNDPECSEKIKAWIVGQVGARGVLGELEGD